MTDEVTCPECGHAFGGDDDGEEDENDEPMVIGECGECERDIRIGEWHVFSEIDSERVPDGTLGRTTSTIKDEDDEDRGRVRLCVPCSDRDEEEIREQYDGEVAA